MTPPELPARSRRRAFGLIGLGAALFSAVLCVVCTAWCLYDIAYLARGANDWGDPAVTDLLLAGIINVPGWLVVLGLAVLLRPLPRSFVVATLALVVTEVFLLTLVPTAFRLNKARHDRAVNEMVRQLERR